LGGPTYLRYELIKAELNLGLYSHTYLPTPVADILIGNNHPQFGYTLDLLRIEAVAAGANFFSLDLVDFDAAAFSSVSLPLAAPDLDAFELGASKPSNFGSQDFVFTDLTGVGGQVQAIISGDPASRGSPSR